MVVEVADTGIGIAESALAHLFEDYAQADASISRRYGGTGLGLSIVRRLVGAMGGRVSVDSTPGVGTTFRLHLPLHLRPRRPRQRRATWPCRRRPS